MKQRTKTGIKIVLTLIVSFLFLWLLQRLLVPKYMSDVIEGAFIAEYYEEKDKEFDVLMIGDCEVYENFTPMVLWEEYGIHSYIRGSAEQYVWQSYYMLEDTLRYYTPKVVVFNVLSMNTDVSKSEAYNRMTLEGMEWSMSKVNAIRASMTEEEHFLDYVFPILRYHSRWSELTAEDFKYIFKRDTVSFNGYYMRIDTKPVGKLPAKRMLTDYSFGENAWNYLEKMTKLCKENGIQLILIKAPSLYPHWYDEWEAQIEEYAVENELPYINFLEQIDEIGLDFSQDTYDAGLHMNLSGATKLTSYFGRILSEEYGVPDRSAEADLSAIWEEKRQAYDAEIEKQKEKYGIQ